MNIRIGQGIDFHRLATGRPLWLGGIRIPSEKGSVAHSDGDVLIHAICDALLGAAGLRDIGHQFPDTDDRYKDIDSKVLLMKVVDLIRDEGFEIINIDSTICLEAPKISGHIGKICNCIAEVCNMDSGLVSVKATTTEKMGFTGREEGIIAMAVTLLNKK